MTKKNLAKDEENLVQLALTHFLVDSRYPKNQISGTQTITFCKQTADIEID